MGAAVRPTLSEQGLAHRRLAIGMFIDTAVGLVFALSGAVFAVVALWAFVAGLDAVSSGHDVSKVEHMHTIDGIATIFLWIMVVFMVISTVVTTVAMVMLLRRIQRVEDKWQLPALGIAAALLLGSYGPLLVLLSIVGTYYADFPGTFMLLGAGFVFVVIPLTFVGRLFELAMAYVEFSFRRC